MIAAFTVLALITLIGYGILRVLRVPEVHSLATIGTSYIVGIGIVTYLMFLLNVAGVPYTLLSILALIATLLVVLLSVLKFFKITTKIVQTESRKIYTAIKYKLSSLNATERFFSILLFLIALWTVAYSSYWPVKDWDSIVLYDFRAKTFVQSGYMDEGIAYGYFFGYPLLTSLAHTIIYLVGFQYPGVIHSLFYVSFLLIFYSFLRLKLTRVWALIWTFILSMSGTLIDHALITYTNLAYTVYLVSGYLFLMQWISTKKIPYLLLSGILIGLSTWTRSTEPFWMIVVVGVIIVSLWQKKWYLSLAFIALVLLFKHPWTVFERSHLDLIRVPSETAANAPKTWGEYLTLKTLPSVIAYFWEYIIVAGRSLYMILALSITYLVFDWKRAVKNTENLALSIFILLNVGAIFAGIFWFSLEYSDWKNIGGSATRLSLFINPLILYLAALVLAPLCASTDTKKKKK